MNWPRRHLLLAQFCVFLGTLCTDAQSETLLQRAPCTKDLTSAVQSWRMCWPDLRYGGCARGHGVPAKVPGTVLATMLRTNFSELDPYMSENLWKIPDIHQVGREFYTVSYHTRISEQSSACSRRKRTLLLRGTNYIAKVKVDGKEVASVTGMFKRLYVSVPVQAFDLEVDIEPPRHFGVNATKDCGWKNCGQGGDHALAADGPVMQFGLGWDWIQATPDRHTGLWDRVQLIEHDGTLLKDVFVRSELHQRADGGTDALLQVEASAGDPGLTWRVRAEASELLSAEGTVRVPGFEGSGAMLQGAKLWWPWQHGEPWLYTLEVLSGDEVVHSQLFGIRHSEVYYDHRTDGPAFKINGMRIFLAGANWITTDQLLRFAADPERYDNEVRLLKEAGVNTIRVWGGGLAERPEFYDACDRHGMLVYQEFWMTGDNNGEQAGEYSWPLNHQHFIDNVEDTVLLLRRHPSLFWWGGGNELYPTELSPPSNIRDAQRRLIKELDGSRPYIQTSALLQQMKFYDPKDVGAALAVDDGPYGAQPPSEFFVRNPALHSVIYPNRTGLRPFPLSINPEVGGPNWPTYSGLRKFISTSKSPSRKGVEVPDEFQFHNFEAFNIDMTVNRPNDTNTYNRTEYDPIYDLFATNRISLDQETYSWRANLVQYVQYRCLFEGYLQHQWSWYAGVLLWKAQTPWPSLRGFVYDWYLERNAAHTGMRLALQHLDHVQISLGTCGSDGAGLFRVNRHWVPVPPLSVTVSFHHLPDGQEVSRKECNASSAQPEDVLHVCDIRWPSADGAFLVRIMHQTVVHRARTNVVDYILSDPCNKNVLVPAMDYRNLDENRLPISVTWLEDPNVTVSAGVPRVNRVVVSNRNSQVALLVHPRLFDAAGQEVLPVWWSSDFFNLLPGESQILTWEGPKGKVVMSGFNVLSTDTTSKLSLESVSTFV